MVLCAGKGTVDFEKLPPIGSCSQHEHLLRHLSLIFAASLAKIKIIIIIIIILILDLYKAISMAHGALE